jgi:DivIVA domain-containing protein
VSAGDLVGLRFTPALRGYRMDQVDAVLDRLGQELADRDEELARLRDHGTPPEQEEAKAEPEPEGAPSTPGSTT